ncbi:MAG: hemolysin III family protein [Saprospiraceae bacterium]|nr:hemolysin III family protein [Pyrinomonadaceae bacterium]
MLKTKLKHLTAEEFANTITHGFGLVLSIVGFFVLVTLAVIRGDAWLIIGSIVYGVSLVTLYAASTCYHATNCPIRKKNLQIVDHCCIYLLIAGSYTPFGIVILDGIFGLSLLVLIWTFALVGVLMKLFFHDRFPIISTMSYLLMGWLGIFALQPLFDALGIMPIILAVIGGIAYSLGVIFFAWHRIPHNHAIFHLFVLAGSIFHYLAIAIYVVP